MHHTYLTSFGVKLDIEVQAEALKGVVELILPPGWEPLKEFPEDGHFTLRNGADGLFDVVTDGAPVATGVTADVAVHVLDSQIRNRIAVLAHDRIFVHAGTVAVDGYALLIPGTSFSGKSTLVAALVAEGATYYSDEFAVLDHRGMVHPYPRMLSLRTSEKVFRGYTTVETLGGRSGLTPATVSMICPTRFAIDTRWDPQRRNAGFGALALLANAIPARPRTDDTLTAVSRAAEDAVVLESDRGEAQETAELMLTMLRTLAEPGDPEPS